MKIVHLLSGGLDSVVMAHHVLSFTRDVRCLGFHYGQKHFKELDAARRACERLNLPFKVVDLAGVFSKSKLVDNEGGIVVPNHNLVFLSVGGALASSYGFTHVSIACNKDDYTLFPDCRPEFLDAAETALLAGAKVGIYRPFVHMTKREVVELGRKWDVPMDDTWSCYVGGQEPCGKCHACLVRAEAMQ